MRLFSGSDWATLFNVQYGACFSVIFSLSVSVTSQSEGMGSVAYSVPPSELASFIVLLAYFFVDWVGINLRSHNVKATPITIFGVSLWIWFLGLCVILSKSPSNVERIVTIGVYVLGASGYHIIKYTSGGYSVDSDSYLMGLILSAISCVFGIALLIVGLGTIVAGQLPPGGSHANALALFCAPVLLLKALELYYFNKGAAQA